MRHFIAIAALLLLCSCETPGEYSAKMSRWVGASERDLVTAWGVPDKQYQVDARTKTLAYVDTRNVNYPGTFNTCVGGFGGRFSYNNCVGGMPPSSEYYTCETTFMIVNGLVTKWGNKGNGCHTP